MAARALALLAAWLAAPALAAPESYTIDPSHTFPSFEVDHLGYSTQRGRFNRSAGRIVLDRAAGSGRIEVDIDAASIDTGLPRLEEVLQAEDWLHSARWPRLRYTAERLRFEDGRLVGADGHLSLLGETRPLTLTVTRFRCAPHPLLRRTHCGADATATLRRSDYGMGRFLPAVGDEVRLLIQVEATADR